MRPRIITALPLLCVLGTTAAAASRPSCLPVPTDADCEFPPDVAADNYKALCEAMPFMSGCSDAIPRDKISSFELVATVCQQDPQMQGMRGCANWKTVCLSNDTTTGDASSSLSQSTRARGYSPSSSGGVSAEHHNDNDHDGHESNAVANSAPPADGGCCTGRSRVRRSLHSEQHPLRLSAEMRNLHVSAALSSRAIPNQCKNQPGIKLPTTKQVNDLVRSICTEMDMEGCSECFPDLGKKWGSCDLLKTYMKLCYEMPEMDQCLDLYPRLCDRSFTAIATGSDSKTFEFNLPFCKNSDNAVEKPPVMKMYFNDDLPFYLLFKWTTPRTAAQYWGAFFAMIVFGIVFEGLQTCKPILEVKLPYGMRKNVFRGLLSFVAMVVGYALMLAVMCFNTGMFFAACIGVGLGAFFFGRFRPEPSKTGGVFVEESCC